MVECVKGDRHELADRITLDPKVLVGKPVIKGTRLAVEFIVELLAEGWTHEQIVENYSGVVEADIEACVDYTGGTPIS